MNATRLLLLHLLIVSLLFRETTAAVASIDLFVSPSGSDTQHDGSLAKPFETLARAQTEVRSRKAASPLAPINVFLRRGRYELLETLEFAASDGGATADAPVTYQAFCDAALETSLTSIEPFPYKSHVATPPRQLWNGNGDQAAWTGPFDPFLEMDVNRTSNAVLVEPPTLPAPIPNMDVGNVCVDKAVTGGPSDGASSGGGHTCYAGAVAVCVSGCQAACGSHLERKTYAPELYRQFSHLFGKQLALEEDCVEICALACRGCEPVVLSGAKRIAPGELTSWTLHKTVALSSDGGGGPMASIFRADLTPFLPATTAPDNPTVVSSLYVNDVQLPRAGFPNCRVVSDVGTSLSEFDCSYATPVATAKPKTMAFNKASFSPRVAQWTKPALAEIELLPNTSHSQANLRYRIASVNADAGEMTLGAGGAQLTEEIFSGGVDLSTSAAAGSARFRVENVLEELDAPGEWYFDPSTKFLFMMPLDATTATTATMATLTLEIPLLRQLVRVSGSRENVYTAAQRASSLLVEAASMLPAANLVFRQLTFSGTQLLTSDVYERIPGYMTWPMARVGAVFLETVANITVESCTFEKIGGNAVVVSGESDTVSVHHNNVSYVGSSGVALLARVGAQRNSLGQPVLAHQLFSRRANVSSNQIHHVGRRVAHSSAIMVVGATQTTVHGNLIYAFPPATGRNYWIANADGSGATRDSGTFGLVRGLDTIITIPQTLATSLLTAYIASVVVASPGFDIPVIAKLIGAPECPSGSGRIGSLYGEPLPFTYTQCSGCCSVHANGAKIRVAGSGIPWADARSREVVLKPGESLELQAVCSGFFNSITDVYVGFHVVTTNQILELPSVRAKWTIVTRKCQYAERTYLVQCSGPCASSATSPLTATGCGNSNIALQMSRGGALKCAVNSEPDMHSLVCRGPFEATADCDGSGVPKSHVFYDCSMKCFTTTCT